MKRIDLDSDYLVREYLGGRSEYALAQDLGVARLVIRRHLVERSISPRGRSEAGLLRASRMTPTERMAQAANAHAASRGRSNSLDALCRAAKTRQERRVGISAKEEAFAVLLTERGLGFIQQMAIGPYNCDFAIPPVAVEIFGGHWHWHGHHLARTEQRLRRILNAGYHILILTEWGAATRHRICEARVADYVVAYVEAARSDPSLIGKYRVVRGAGELIASGCVEDDHLSIMPTFTTGRDPITGQYTSVPR